jgi:hypothetical protein
MGHGEGAGIRLIGVSGAGPAPHRDRSSRTLDFLWSSKKTLIRLLSSTVRGGSTGAILIGTNRGSEFWLSIVRQIWLSRAFRFLFEGTFSP